MKKILFTLCLAAALTGARGQIYIDSYRFGAAPVSDDLLLDSFPTAELAISLRKLDKDYTGNCITIQKDNGDTSVVDFSGNYLDTAAVKTFCGTGAGDSCRVRVWFDQSGNARNFRQDTTASQPLIMIDGALTYDNGEISVRFNGTTSSMVIPSSTSTFNFIHNGGNATFFTVQRFGSVSNPNAVLNYISNGGGFISNVGFAIAYDDRSSVPINNGHRILVNNGTGSAIVVNMADSDKITPNQISLLYTRFDANNATAASRAKGAFNGGAEYGNNTSTGTPTGSNATSNFFLGRNPGTLLNYFGGAVQEIVLYNANKSSDKSAIEGNINRFYSIY
jgi:hypothetical protein